MGSFFSSCSVTNMVIGEQQEMVRILLVPRTFNNKLPDNSRYDRMPRYDFDSRDNFKDKGLIIPNLESGMFVPFGFPIRGIYADYGEIEIDQEDRNTKKLEDFFGLTIDQIMHCAGDDRWYTQGIVDKNNVREKLENAIKNLEDYYLTKKEDYNTEQEWLKQGKLLRENLEKIKSETKFKIGYNDESSVVQPKNLEVLINLTFTDIKSEIYDLLTQKDNSRDWNNSMREEWTENYFKANKQLRELELDKNTDQKSLLAKLKKTLDITLHDYDKGFLRHVSYNFLRLLDIGEEFRKEYCDMYNFLVSLNSLNKMLIPSYSGGQEFNYDFLTELNNKANELMAVEIQKHKDFYADEEEKNE